MARLIVVYDPRERLSGISPQQRDALGLKEATISVARDLDAETIAEISRHLAAMLLEQVARDE